MPPTSPSATPSPIRPFTAIATGGRTASSTMTRTAAHRSRAFDSNGRVTTRIPSCRSRLRLPSCTLYGSIAYPTAAAKPSNAASVASGRARPPSDHDRGRRPTNAASTALTAAIAKPAVASANPVPAFGPCDSETRAMSTTRGCSPNSTTTATAAAPVVETRTPSSSPPITMRLAANTSVCANVPVWSTSVTERPSQ